MPDMTDRGRAMENRFAQDAELRFRAEARRNRHIAQWAAERLGKSPGAADAYADEVMRADFQTAGPEDVIAKLIADLEGTVTESEIRARFAEIDLEAKVHVFGQNNVN